jgi:VanZ family protein
MARTTASNKNFLANLFFTILPAMSRHFSFYYLLAACAWLVLITILLCLPGAAFPQETWMDRLYVDKLVHAFLFFILIVLFAQHLQQSELPLADKLHRLWWIVLLACAHGLIMELVQKFYIPHRAFDWKDFLADSAGAWLGWWLRKKRL